jgi:hypothetical protein
MDIVHFRKLFAAAKISSDFDSAPKGAVANYPAEMVELAASRPPALRVYDFVLSRYPEKPSTNLDIYGYPASYSSGDSSKKEQLCAQEFSSTIDPCATPHRAIEWVKLLIACRATKKSADMKYPRLLEAIDISLRNSQLHHGYQGYLLNPDVVAVTAELKFCWVLASFIDYFSAPDYRDEIEKHFNAIRPSPGQSVFLYLKDLYLAWLTTRFNEPTLEETNRFFIPHFKSTLDPVDLAELSEHVDQPAWFDWDELCIQIKRKKYTIKGAQRLFGAIKHDRSGYPKTDKQMVDDAFPPHPECLCDSCLVPILQLLKAAVRCKSCFQKGCRPVNCRNPIALSKHRCKKCGFLQRPNTDGSHRCPTITRPCSRCNSMEHFETMCPSNRDGGAPPFKKSAPSS